MDLDEISSLNKVQEYWNRRPCNLKHSNEPIGSKKYFEEVSKRRYFVEPHILEFMDAKNYKNKKVLEIGCGIGTDAAVFAENGANYYGIELSEESLLLTKKRFEEFNLLGNFSHSSIEEIDLKTFDCANPDLVYCFGVLHHTVNPQYALKKLVDQINSGATFKFMLYAKNSIKSALINNHLDQPEAQDNCPIAFTYTREQVFELFTHAGLQVTSVDQDHIFTYNLEKYKNYEYKTEPWYELMPKPMFEALRKELGWHLLITAQKI
jgi:2-polyprenyl-3-methyl-5-hydroxy-6-metoxy-1,4-benzoquinol methylase